MSKYVNLNKQFIDGQWLEGNGADEIISYNPYTDQEYVRIQAASMEDVDKAFKAAERAQKEWANTNPYEKHEILRKAADILEARQDEIVEILINDSGSTFAKATQEFNTTVQIIRLAETMPFKMETIANQSMIPGKRNKMIRRAKGVVGVIGPFNYPLYLAMRSVAPAIATGNSVVLKGASKTPVAGGSFIAKLFEEAGLPKGVFNFITPKISDIGDGFYAHPIPEVISFTGSTEVGREIGKVAGEQVKDVILELGGNNPQVILDDADVDQAVKSSVFGSFFHSGQICMAINRIIVDEKIIDEFSEKFVEASQNVKSGDPNEKDTIIGPLITSDEVDRVQEAIQKAKDQGAEILLEGKREGNVLSPSVIRGSNETYTATKEMFGPIVTIIPAKDENHAIELANAVNEGLTSGVHSKDLRRAQRVAGSLEVGMAHVNDQSVNDEPYIAFGGEKASGIGRFGRDHSLDAFTTWQWISVQEEPRQYPTD